MAASAKCRTLLKYLLERQEAAGIEEDEAATTLTIGITIARYHIAEQKKAARAALAAQAAEGGLTGEPSELLRELQEEIQQLADGHSPPESPEAGSAPGAETAAESVSAEDTLVPRALPAGMALMREARRLLQGEEFWKGLGLGEEEVEDQVRHEVAMEDLDTRLGLVPRPPPPRSMSPKSESSGSVEEEEFSEAEHSEQEAQEGYAPEEGYVPQEGHVPPSAFDFIQVEASDAPHTPTKPAGGHDRRRSRRSQIGTPLTPGIGKRQPGSRQGSILPKSPLFPKSPLAPGTPAFPRSPGLPASRQQTARSWALGVDEVLAGAGMRAARKSKGGQEL
eukprot:Hpha_TRINITY_DN16811_c3_g5::TRINITY_DN16811_c3_g5_i1::g.151288::m.151288